MIIEKQQKAKYLTKIVGYVSIILTIYWIDHDEIEF
jgi:hypothetical protein